MPSHKLRADQHLLVMVAACSALDPVGAAQLAERTGISAKNCGLVPVFALNSGLLVKGHRRATYLPSEKGRYVARAFQRGEAEGLAALRSKWKGQWFARCVRDRCRYGPVSREGLVAKLMVAARAETERLKQAHVLVDLMVAVGLVTVEATGELHWFEGRPHGHPVRGPRRGRSAGRGAASRRPGARPGRGAGECRGQRARWLRGRGRPGQAGRSQPACR